MSSLLSLVSLALFQFSSERLVEPETLLVSMKAYICPTLEVIVNVQVRPYVSVILDLTCFNMKQSATNNMLR